MYLRKAGTLILAASIVLWFAMNYPNTTDNLQQDIEPGQIQQQRLENSIIGRLGKTIEPAIEPLGFDWKIGTALIGATAAKELFVSQLSIIYAVGGREDAVMNLRQMLQADYTPLTGFCIMLFCLIYAPCIATIAMTKQETNSWGWALFQFFGLTVLAYVVTLAVFQIGSRIL